MPIQTNTNVSPYYDDFDPQKNFHRVMFKPGYPVQARELTQLQSILSDQIEKISSKILRTGDTVVPGEYGVNTFAPYVRVSSITQGASAHEFIGYTLTGVTSGAKAFVNFAEEETDDDDVTFFVDYVSSGDTNEERTFIEGETLESDTPNFLTATVGINETSKPIDTPPMGMGSVFSVKEGSFYIDGTVVRSDEQIISLDKYGSTPTYKVGFIVDEDFITSEDDQSLKDNAQGSSNFAAPGADRLKITLTLAKRILNPIGPVESDPHFVYLVDIVEGAITGNPNQTGKWDWLYDLLAQRTYDESGDYITQDFVIKPLEYWNSATINGEVVDIPGIFDPDEDGLYDPVPTEESTQKLTFEEADDRYVIVVSPGQAFVRGYDVGFKDDTNLYGHKSRTENLILGTTIQINAGISLPISDVHGMISIENSSSVVNTLAFNSILTYRNFTDGFVGDSTRTYTIGSDNPDIVPINGGNKPLTTYHVTVANPVTVIGGVVEIYDSVTDTTISNVRVVYSNDNSLVLAPPANLDDTYPVIKRGHIVNRLTPGATGSIGDGAESGDNESWIINAFRFDPIATGIVTPKYIDPNLLIEGGEGDEFLSSNSTFDVGITQSSFFTEFTIESENESLDWVFYNLIQGRTSNAIGKIQPGSTNRVLIISDIIGEFINGEEVIQRRQSIGGAPAVKTARILNPGEIVGFVFDDYRVIGGGSEGNSGIGGGGNIIDPNADIFTPNVRLVYEAIQQQRNFPNEAGLKTQEEANIWFYEAIRDLQGSGRNKITLGPAPQSPMLAGDIWVHDESYDMFVWSGDSWVGLNESANSATISLPTPGASGAVSPTIVSPTPTAINYSDNFDLSSVVALELSALGVGLNITIGDDFYHDATYNILVPTKSGREKIYNFQFFNVENESLPRIDITVKAFFTDSRTTDFIRGFCLIPPAKIANTIKKTKSLYGNANDTNSTDFNANISIGSDFTGRTSRDSEVLPLANGSLFSGAAGRSYVTCDNFSGDPSDEIIAGDLVTLINNAGVQESFIALFATKPYGYGENRTRSVIVLHNYTIV